MKNFINTLTGRPNTIKTKKSLYSKWIEPFMPAEDTAFDRDFVLGMVRMWQSEDLAPGTVRGLLSLLHQYIQWRTGRRLHIYPSIKIDQPVKKVNTWDKFQCKAVLAACQHLDKELYKMLVLTLHTGIRKGELFGLRWGDIDFVTGKINISRSYDGPTKSGKPRSIPLSPTVENLLRNDYTIGREDELIFKRRDPNNRLEVLCRNASVPTLTWHGLRHTFATLALEAKVSPKLVQTALGHAKVSTTFDIYWHCTGDDLPTDFLP